MEESDAAGDALEICADSNEFDVDEEELVQLIPSNPIVDPVRSSSAASYTIVSAKSISHCDSSDESDDEYRSTQKRRKVLHVSKDRSDIASLPDHVMEKASSAKTEYAVPELPNMRMSPKTRFPAAHPNHQLYRNNEPVSIHINKHFRGAVQAAPGTCLAWDPVVAGANFRGPSVVGRGGSLPGLQKTFGNVSEGIRGSPAIASRFPVMRPVLPYALTHVISPGLPLLFRPDLMTMRAKPPFLPMGGFFPVASELLHFPPIPSLPPNMSGISRLGMNSMKMNQHRSRGNFGPAITQFKRNRNE